MPTTFKLACAVAIVALLFLADAGAVHDEPSDVARRGGLGSRGALSASEPRRKGLFGDVKKEGAWNVRTGLFGGAAGKGGDSGAEGGDYRGAVRRPDGSLGAAGSAGTGGLLPVGGARRGGPGDGTARTEGALVRSSSTTAAAAGGVTEVKGEVVGDARPAREAPARIGASLAPTSPLPLAPPSPSPPVARVAVITPPPPHIADLEPNAFEAAKAAAAREAALASLRATAEHVVVGMRAGGAGGSASAAGGGSGNAPGDDPGETLAGTGAGGERAARLSASVVATAAASLLLLPGAGAEALDPRVTARARRDLVVSSLNEGEAEGIEAGDSASDASSGVASTRRLPSRIFTLDPERLRDPYQPLKDLLAEVAMTTAAAAEVAGGGGGGASEVADAAAAAAAATASGTWGDAGPGDPWRVPDARLFFEDRAEGRVLIWDAADTLPRDALQSRQPDTWLYALLTPQFDGDRMLEAFLEHYSRLGIRPERMLFVVNWNPVRASDDGEAEMGEAERESEGADAGRGGGARTASEPRSRRPELPAGTYPPSLRTALKILRAWRVDYTLWAGQYSSEEHLARRLETLRRVPVSDWIVLADSDEFHDYGNLTIPAALAAADAAGGTFVRGKLYDRVAEGGKLAEVAIPGLPLAARADGASSRASDGPGAAPAVAPPLFAQFPLSCEVASRVAGSERGKVVAHRGFLRAGAGSHGIVGPSAARSYFGPAAVGERSPRHGFCGARDLFPLTPYGPYAAFYATPSVIGNAYLWAAREGGSVVIVHHFKWHAGVAASAKDRLRHYRGDDLESPCVGAFQHGTWTKGGAGRGGGVVEALAGSAADPVPKSPGSEGSAVAGEGLPAGGQRDGRPRGGAHGAALIDEMQHEQAFVAKARAAEARAAMVQLRGRLDAAEIPHVRGSDGAGSAADGGSEGAGSAAGRAEHGGGSAGAGAADPAAARGEGAASLDSAARRRLLSAGRVDPTTAGEGGAGDADALAPPAGPAKLIHPAIPRFKHWKESERIVRQIVERGRVPVDEPALRCHRAHNPVRLPLPADIKPLRDAARRALLREAAGGRK